MSQEKPYVDIHYSEFPLVWVEFTGHKATKANFEAYLEGLKKTYDRQERLVLLFDARKVPFPGLPYQLRQARWLRDNDALIRKYCQGTAYLIAQPWIRAALKMIFAWQKNPVPTTVLAEPEEAREWGQEKMGLK